jgi:hypothetical protein
MSDSMSAWSSSNSDVADAVEDEGLHEFTSGVAYGFGSQLPARRRATPRDAAALTGYRSAARR